MANARPWAAWPALVLAAVLFPICAPLAARTPARAPAWAGDAPSCLSCHQGIEDAGAGHAMACGVCHLLPDARGAPPTDHRDVIPNPAHPRNWRAQCGPCHPGEVRAVERSPHATLAGIINQTRYLWGAQPVAEPPIFGANGHPRPLPPSADRPRGTGMLVDSFLRARCLDCHVGTSGPGGPGLHRGTGCAACHAAYGADGLYRGGDRAVDRSRPSRPARHGLSAAGDDARCLRCHNGNRVGGDYYGQFERDGAPMFQRALSWGQPMPRPYGTALHALARDAHAERGMACLDCHTGAQVMGLAPGDRPSCRGCHGDRDGTAPDTALANVAAGRGGFVFHRRDGRTVPLPRLPGGVPGHDAALHGRLACAACHAQWTFGDFGLSVLRRDDAAGGEWRTGYRFRRWEILVLGVDGRGRIAPLRPLYQYLVSYVDRLGRTQLDSVAPVRGDGSGTGWAFAPYAPHTTAPRGRSCQRCHGTPEAAGLPAEWAPSPDFALLRPSPPVPGHGRLLRGAELRRLLEPGGPYRGAFAASLLRATEER